MRYPKKENSKRPFRLYLATAEESTPLPSRNYKYKETVHLGAMQETRWAKVGTTIEVVDVSIGKMRWSYTRKVNTLTFTGS